MANSTVTGLKEFRAGLQHGMINQRTVIREQFTELGARMVNEMRIRAPKKSGALAASIRDEVIDTNNGERLNIQIGNAAVPYAAHVEYGDSHAPAHPFVRPVAMAYQKVIPVQMTEAIQDSWSKS